MTKRTSFPQAFFPVLLEGNLGSDPCQNAIARNAGDVAFTGNGDLFAVADTSDIYAVSRANGACRLFVHASGGPAFLSITPGSGDDTRFFVGDDQGRIWVVAADGSSATVFVDTGNQPITGLAFAPKGYGDLDGSLLAAAGTAGLLRIAGEAPEVSTFVASPGGSFVDLAFSGKTLFAIRRIDATHGQIDTIDVTDTTGTATTFQTGFIAPVGLAVDADSSELYVADAGDDILKTVPVDGGAPTKRAHYDFDTSAVNGIASDGVATLAWITRGPLAIRASRLPRIDPANTNFNQSFVGPTSGYGDLEFDRNGDFVLVANDEDDPDDDTDTANDYLFNVPRDLKNPKKIESNIGTPPEQLFAIAIDPVDQVIYFSSFSLGAAVETGKIYKRPTSGDDPALSLLVDLTPGVRVLGLELAPPTFGSFGRQLIATTADTADNRIFAIDPLAPSSFVPIPLSQAVSNLVDLVFASTGELYAVENNGSANLATASRILRITSSGTVTVIAPSSAQLGAADGIEIDEGGHRLLVTSETAGGFQVLEVSLGATPATVKPLANIQIDNGFFPTGIVYDRLGTVVFRKNDATTQLGAASVAP